MLLPDGNPNVHPIIFESITIEEVQKNAMWINGGSSSSRIDTDGRQKVLTSTSYGESNSNVCQAIAWSIRNICAKTLDMTNLEVLLACHLIPLIKNPGAGPVDVGEILRQTVGKVVIVATRNIVITSVAALQVCAGYDALIYSIRSFPISDFYTAPM